MIKAGINGFGRIGRLAFRAAMANENVEIVGINAPDKSPELIAYTIKYDTVHGRYNGTVSYDDSAVIVDGKRIPLLSKRNASELPWGELGAEYVMECTGRFLTTESAQAHIDAGASIVILSGPSKDATPMFVMGVNNDKYTTDMKVISNASCTTNCLSPIAKVLHDNWGIVEGLMTTVHACTATQKTVDGFSTKDW